MKTLLLVVALNLNVPADVYEDIDMEIEAERVIQQDLRKRSNIRLHGADDKSPAKSNIQIKNRGMKNSRTNISVGFPI